MPTLFIDPSKIVKETVIGANVDMDKYVFSIENVQITMLERLFGTELYDKLLSDYENDTLSDDYLTIYNEYLVPILKFQSAAEYIEVCSYIVDNGGIFRHAPEKKEIPDRKDIDAFAERYRSMAQVYIERFNKWICLNDVDEYKRWQDEVNASNTMKATGGIWFGNAQRGDKWSDYNDLKNDYWKWQE